MRVRVPLTCGLMVAERRDLMVATYWSDWGTGWSATVRVCTGRACMPAPAGCCGWAYSQPATPPASRSDKAGMMKVISFHSCVLEPGSKSDPNELI